jgi:hypothetical protein
MGLKGTCARISWSKAEACVSNRQIGFSIGRRRLESANIACTSSLIYVNDPGPLVEKMFGDPHVWVPPDNPYYIKLGKSPTKP